MGQKFIISDFYKNHLLGFQLSDGTVHKIVDLADENIVGNIYCGHIIDVVKNIDAAFVQIGSQKGFLSTKKMKQKVQCGDKVLVQVEYDAIKTKDYGLTTNLSLPGTSLVLTVGSPAISISKKIQDEDKRTELKEWMKKYRNDDYGFIIRTQSQSMTKEQILQEADQLIERLETIRKKFSYSRPKELLWEENKMVTQTKSFLEQHSGEIITDNSLVAEQLKEHRIAFRFFETGKISLYNLYRLDQVVEQCLSKKVWLKSGAYLIFDYTEALTVVDVNSGQAEIKGDKENVIFQINQEAVWKIAEQMELRNLSGIVLVDFINMKNEKHKEKILDLLNQILKSQSVFCKAYGFTRLGLMEISRKKKDKPFHEIV